MKKGAKKDTWENEKGTCKCLENSIAINFPVTHVDGSTRVQIVEENSFLGDLLEYLKEYNIEILANSSLNFSGDPTCYDLIDGLLVCSNSKLEYLFTDFGILKNIQKP